MSFTRGYEAAHTHEGRVELIMGEVLEGQQKMSANFDARLDTMYSNLNEKFEGFSAHLKKLDSQVAHYAGIVRREEGFFTGRTDTNPRHPVNVITLRSGRRLTPHQRKEMEELDQVEGLEEVQPDLDEKEAESLIVDSIDRQQLESVDRHPVHPDPQPFKSFKPAVSRIYRPKTPFPPTQMKAKRELEKAICKKAFDKLNVELPLSDSIQISLPIKK